MSEESNSGPAAAGAPGGGPGNWVGPEEQGAPWIDPAIQQRVRWRSGDVVISVPVKSGTTWMMNIVHQLRAGGDPDLDDIYLEVPWIEFLGGPSVTPDDVLSKVEAMPRDARRAFKTHAAPAQLPYVAPGSAADVKYVVVARNPDEVVASFYPFLKAHAEAWFALWGIDKQELVPPDMATYFETFGKTMLADGLFGFMAGWWPLRDQPNVLLLHFSDMKRDHEGSVRRIAGFLDIEPTPEQWARILEYTSFPWMKKHEAKFELRHAAERPVLDPGAMMRKGKVGAAREDGVTPEMSAELGAIGKGMLSDEQAFDWLYKGDALP